MRQQTSLPWPAITVVSTVAALLLGLLVGALLGKATVKPIKIVETAPRTSLEVEHKEWIEADVFFKAADRGEAKRLEQRWYTIRGTIADIDLDRALPTVTVAKGKVKLLFSFDSTGISRAEASHVGDVVQFRAWCVGVVEHPDGILYDMSATRIEEWIKKVGY
jgi:hypothetical protein